MGSVVPLNPPMQPVTIFLRPTFAIIPSVGGLDVRVVASAPVHTASAPASPTARA